MKLEIIKTKSFGLEIYKVLVNNTLDSTHLSKELAITKMMKLKIKIEKEHGIFVISK